MSQTITFLSILLTGVSGYLQNTTLRISTLATYNGTGMAPCDALLNAGLGSYLLLPNDAAFENSISSYWQSNSRIRPWCIFQPHSTQEVAQAMAVLSSMGKDVEAGGVAIKSGGHSTANLANGIQNGITIDLGAMNTTSFNPSTGLASLEPGARWANVYAALSHSNVTVAGGRDGDVGVGGLLLGGGISLYAAKVGFSVDNVVAFEVVLANGEVAVANQSSHADLWKSLKGGINNFGVVTRFDVMTIPGQEVAYSQRSISNLHSDAYIDAVVQFTEGNSQAPDDAIIGFYTHLPTAPGVSIVLIEANVAGRANSTGFSQFNRIPSNVTESKITSLAVEAAGSEYVGSQRDVGSTLTIRNDARIIREAVKLHEDLVSYLSDRIGSQNFVTTCFFEPIPSSVQELGQSKGGNMLGLPKGEDVIIVDAGVEVLTDDADLALAHAALRKFSAQVAEAARSFDGLVDLQYGNYADASQEVIGSYPAENVQFMKAVAAIYDPKGFFQKRVSGGFKLP